MGAARAGPSRLCSFEGRFHIATGTLRSFSEQQVTDCTDNGNGTSTGCQGGLMTTAFEYLIKNQGIDSEEDYQYVGLNSPCWAAGAARHVAVPDSYKTVPASEAQLAAAIAQGPVAVGIEADQAAFQHYSNGTFDGACGTNVDHGVTAVGLTDDAYIVKNSCAWPACASGPLPTRARARREPLPPAAAQSSSRVRRSRALFTGRGRGLGRQGVHLHEAQRRRRRHLRHRHAGLLPPHPERCGATSAAAHSGASARLRLDVRLPRRRPVRRLRAALLLRKGREHGVQRAPGYRPEPMLLRVRALIEVDPRRRPRSSPCCRTIQRVASHTSTIPAQSQTQNENRKACLPPLRGVAWDHERNMTIVCVHVNGCH